jgi:hypothetical protein
MQYENKKNLNCDKGIRCHIEIKVILTKGKKVKATKGHAGSDGGNGGPAATLVTRSKT